MKTLYKSLLTFGLLLILNFTVSAQIANCDDFCVTDIQIDTINKNSLLVSIYIITYFIHKLKIINHLIAIDISD